MLRTVVLWSAVAAIVAAAWTPVGPDGANVTALAVSRSAPSTMVATVYYNRDSLTVFRTTDRGTTWWKVGTVPYVDGVLFDAFDPTVVYGTGGPMFYRSTDGGGTWLSASLPLSVAAAACDPFVPGRVYSVGTLWDTIPLPAVGISTDNGATWSSAAVTPERGSICAVDPSPLDSGTVFIGGDGGRLFRSTDHGLTWQLRANGLPPGATVSSVTAGHGDTGLLLAGTDNGVYRTTDGGATWNPSAGPTQVASVDFSPAEPLKAYCCAYDTSFACFATTDAGATWQHGARVNRTSGRNCLIADPLLGDGVWCPAANGVVHSTDRGAHWRPANGGIRGAAVTALAVPVWNREQAYVALENIGLFRSDDAGRNWQKLPDFLACGNLCGIGLTRGTPHDRLYAFEGSG